jgi:hypothetical protein
MVQRVNYKHARFNWTLGFGCVAFSAFVLLGLLFLFTNCSSVRTGFWKVSLVRCSRFPVWIHTTYTHTHATHIHACNTHATHTQSCAVNASKGTLAPKILAPGRRTVCSTHRQWYPNQAARIRAVHTYTYIGLAVYIHRIFGDSLAKNTVCTPYN